jgi:hypothetical protein
MTNTTAENGKYKDLQRVAVLCNSLQFCAIRYLQCFAKKSKALQRKRDVNRCKAFVFFVILVFISFTTLSNQNSC